MNYEVGKSILLLLLSKHNHRLVQKFRMFVLISFLAALTEWQCGQLRLGLNLQMIILEVFFNVPNQVKALVVGQTVKLQYNSEIHYR